MAKKVIKKAVKPVAKKAAKPTAKKNAKPVAKKAVKSAPKKAVKSAPKKAAKPVAKKVVKPTAKKIAKPAPKKAVKQAPKKAVKTVAKKAVKPAPKKAVKPTSKINKPVAKKDNKPVAKTAKQVSAKSVKPTPAPKKAIKPAPAPKAVKEAKAAKPSKVEKVTKPVKAEKPVPAPKKQEVVKPALPQGEMQVKKAPETKQKERTVGESILNKPVDLKMLNLNAEALPTNKVHEPARTIKHVQKDNRNRYSDEELLEFKTIILKKLEEARKDFEILKDTLSHKDDHGTDDTSPTFKLLEDGSDVLSREETAQLAGRQQKFIESLENALIRIENKTYGICRVTGSLISKERLRSVPHATLSIEAKLDQNNR